MPDRGQTKETLQRQDSLLEKIHRQFERLDEKLDSLEKMMSDGGWMPEEAISAEGTETADLETAPGQVDSEAVARDPAAATPDDGVQAGRRAPQTPQTPRKPR